MDAIFNRRSIRRYTKEQVSDELAEMLLRAGMCAPSARNQRPWHFIVIRDARTLKELSHTHRYSEMVKDAPLAIVVCGDTKIQSYKDYWVLDCSAATENILIAAEHLRLGAVWVAVYPREERIVHVCKVLSLPHNITPLCIIPVGHPAEKPESINRFDISRIHQEHW